MDSRYRHKDIQGYEGLYALGEHGKVYSYVSKKYLSNIKSKKDNMFYVTLYGKGKPKKLYISYKIMDAYFG